LLSLLCIPLIFISFLDDLIKVSPKYRYLLQLLTSFLILGFSNINFNYPGRDLTLKNINFRIENNSTLGIVGLTGSGKSTIIKLLLRIYDSKNGSITLDGVSIKEINLRDLRKCISLVSQETYLFHGSVQENIAYGSINPSLKDIIKASKIAEAHKFIEQLPDGYKTIVGERGQRRAGGNVKELPWRELF